MLVNGKWDNDWHPVQAKDDDGRFIRQTSSFRHWVTPTGDAGPTGDSGFKAQAGRYHLYVALICPWASRALMVRKLKKLNDVIDITVAEPALTDQGWQLGDYPGAQSDPLPGVRYMHEIYTTAAPAFSGRATVPVLWDKKRGTIVNNESADIITMLNSAFDEFGDSLVDLYPRDLRSEIDLINTQLYEYLNNGVYKSGFASSQSAYNEAVVSVFETLDTMEARLCDDRAYLFGNRLTMSDIRLFVTLVRFDAAYHGIFKCNLRRIADYPALCAYMGRIYALPGIADTVNLDHIKAGYYSIKALNPTGIIPAGPALTLAV